MHRPSLKPPAAHRSRSLFGGRARPKVEAACMDVARVQHEGDLSEVRGQPQARRALEIAAAGGHNCFL